MVRKVLREEIMPSQVNTKCLRERDGDINMLQTSTTKPSEKKSLTKYADLDIKCYNIMPLFPLFTRHNAWALELSTL